MFYSSFMTQPVLNTLSSFVVVYIQKASGNQDRVGAYELLPVCFMELAYFV